MATASEGAAVLSVILLIDVAAITVSPGAVFFLYLSSCQIDRSGAHSVGRSHRMLAEHFVAGIFVYMYVLDVACMNNKTERGSHVHF